MSTDEPVMPDSADTGPWDWTYAEDVRREAMRKLTPAERLNLLEELVEFALKAQALNPRLSGIPPTGE